MNRALSVRLTGMNTPARRPALLEELGMLLCSECVPRLGRDGRRAVCGRRFVLKIPAIGVIPIGGHGQALQGRRVVWDCSV